MQVKRMSELDLSGRRVLIRQDLNVPVKDGKVTSDVRIRASLPTLQMALDSGAAVMVMSHLGRPEEGLSWQQQPQYSLAPVAETLSHLLDRPVRLERDWLDGVEVAPGELVILENVRFNQGETSNDLELSRKMAALCDIYVMDAFGTAHRAQSSTEGVARYAPIACAGPLLVAELDALEKALANPRRPLVAIVGGSKVSTKLQVLESLADKVDQLVVGGGIANTFLAAAGKPVGKSLCEPDLIPVAQALQAKTAIPLPEDVRVGDHFGEDAEARLVSPGQVGEGDLIMDVGPQTSAQLAKIMQQAGTIIWNGPLGVFEFDQFGEGTRALSEAIAASDAFSIAGGGDTLAAIEKYGVEDRISYISTGGGAFLEYVEGKVLPAVAVLEERSGS